MAPRGAKRAPAAKVGETPAKAPKQETACPKLAAVLEAVEQADDLPQACRAMLSTALPHALNVPASERHEVELRIVAAVGDVVEETRARMQGAIDCEAAKVAGFDVEKEKLDLSIADAKTKVMAAATAKTEKDTALVSATGIVDEKARTLAQAKAAELEGNSAFESVKADMHGMQGVYENHFKVLRNEELDVSKAQCHLDSLCQSVASVGLDNSLLSSLPSACLKPRSARGQFDNVIFDELEKSLSEHIKTLSEKVAAESPAAAERHATVTEAQRRLTLVEEEAEVARSEFEKAKAEHEEASASEIAATNALASFHANCQGALRALEDRKAALARFEAVSVASFIELRDGISKKADPQEPAADPLTQEGISGVGGA